MPNVSMRYGKAWKLSGGSNGAEEQTSLFTLLWTNASPTSNFAAQTVTLDLSYYNFVMILTRHSTSTAALVTNFATVGSSARLTTVQSTTNKDGTRTARVEETGVVFSASTFNNATDNGFLIPYQIYGMV